MRRWVIGLSCLLVGACGGTARTPEPPAAGENGTRATALAAPNGELATSDLPTDSMFWLRVRSMARDLPALARFDVATAEVKTVLENPRFLVITLVGEEIAEWVDLDAPVDLLLNGAAPYEGTIALRPNQELAKSNDVRRLELAPGRFHIEPTEGADVEAKHCELWESSSAGDRILCGSSEQRVVRAASFLFGRAASTPSGGAAFRMEVSGRALWSSVLEQIEEDERELGSDPSDRAAFELAESWVRGVFAGSRALVAELDLVGSDVELGFELVYEGQGPAASLKTWFASDRPRALPDAFSKLPRDSELTFGFGGVDSGSASVAVREFLRELTETAAKGYEVTESERRDVEAVTFDVMPADGRFVVALGHDRENIRELSARVEAAESAGRAPAAKDVTSLASLLAGWVVVGVEAEPKAYVKNLRRCVEVYSRPAKKKAGADQAHESPLVTHLQIAAKPLPNLPKGSLHIVTTHRPNPDYKPPLGDAKPDPLPHDVHVVAVPDGPRVWITIARDQAVAARRARAQLGANKALGTGSKLSGRTVAAGSLTLMGLAGTTLDGDTPEGRAASSVLLTELAELPNRGRSKIPARIDVVPHADGSAWSVAVRGRLSLPAIKDVVAWLSEPVVGVFQ